MNYILFICIFSSIVFGQSFVLLNGKNLEKDIVNQNKISQDTTSVVLVDKENVIYPGKPLVMSLILPGLGQFYNKSPHWKTATFLGIEIGTMMAWNHFKKEAEDYRRKYQSYADMHWSLENWATNHTNFPNQESNGRYWQNFGALTKLSGTHDLNLVISGTLAEDLGFTRVSSDSLDTNPSWAFSDDVVVVKDRHFYENIGKYDQFLGGWDDANSDWYWEEKDVGDSLEIIIKTPKKQNYINQRYKSNQMLSRVKYSITALMFNHVISGIESVFTSQNNTKNQIKESMSENNYQIDLTYNPLNKFGVGGINLALQF